MKTWAREGYARWIVPETWNFVERGAVYARVVAEWDRWVAVVRIGAEKAMSTGPFPTRQKACEHAEAYVRAHPELGPLN